MIKRKNFTATPIADIPVDAEYLECNFSQSAPFNTNRGHRLFPGDDTPRTFTRCNLMNCEPPPGSTLVECNTWIVERGIVDHTDQVIIDGVVVNETDYHNSRRYGRYNPTTGLYDDEPTPVDTPEDY